MLKPRRALAEPETSTHAAEPQILPAVLGVVGAAEEAMILQEEDSAIEEAAGVFGGDSL